MILVVSPYHLTTREPPAMAALLLADRVVTLMPAPEGGPSSREALAESVSRVPEYLHLLCAWEWTVPLWEAGVIASAFDGHDAGEGVADVCRQLAADERWAVLRPLMRPEVFEESDGYLNAVSRDLLRGGPDPAVLLPVAAAMDRFALRHGLLVARSDATSLAQRAEERLGGRVFAIAVPVLLQSGASRILHVRRVLAGELAALRAAIDAGAGEGPGAGRRVTAAARDYATAFESRRAEILRGADDDEARPVVGLVTLSCVNLPVDAVLRSSVSAYRATVGVTAGGAGGGAVNGHAEAAPDALAERRFLSLIFKPIGKASNGAR